MREQWIALPPLVPGTRPTSHLAHSLQAAFAACGAQRDHADLHRRLTTGPEALVSLTHELSDLGGVRAVLLTVDQGEELLTRTGVAERQAFFDLLEGSLHDGSPLWVLASIRSEFLGAWPNDGNIADIVDDTLVIEPLARGRLPEIIERPAQRAGLEFEPGLVQRMVEDTVGGDALPLLAYTLLQLYERDLPGGKVTLKDYQAVGGVIGALRSRADRVLDELSRRGQGASVLPTLLKLATIERDAEPTRRRIQRATLSDAERSIVDAFMEARLLKSDGAGGDTTVEVAHEALLRQWTPLRERLESSRNAIQLRTAIERSARDWERAEKDDSYLLRGERLLAAVTWQDDPRSDVGELEGEFVQASLALTNRELLRSRRTARRLRSLSIGLAIILGFAVFAATIAAIKAADANDARAAARADAARARTQARLATSRQLAAQATSMIGPQRARSLLLSLAALQVVDTAEAEGSLLAGLESDPAAMKALTTILRASGPAVTAVAVSPDGRLVLAATEDGAVRAWSGRRALRVIRGGSDGTTSIAASPDGRTLASGGNDGRVRIWDFGTGRLLADFAGHTAPVTGVAFSPDGRTLISGSLDNTLRYLDTRSGKQVGAPLVFPGAVEQFAVSPDGRLVASADDRADVRLFRNDSRRSVADDPSLGSRVSRLIFSADGRALTAITAQGKAIVWRTTRFRRQGQPLVVSDRAVTAAAASPGALLAVGLQNGNVVLWSYGSRWQLGNPAKLHRGSVRGLVLAPNGARLASGGRDGSVVVWNVALKSWMNTACAVARRNLSMAEWQQFVGTALRYTQLCQVSPATAKRPRRWLSR